MSELTPLESHVFAYYVQGAANDLNIAGRFYPYGELILVIEDKIQVATRKFGFKVSSKGKSVATAFLDHMIGAHAFSSKTNDFGGTMHQFQGDVYCKELKELQSSNALIQSVGDDWEASFADLTV